MMSYEVDWEDDTIVCSRPNCGRHNWDDGVPLTGIQVWVNESEEGYADITQIFCNQHFCETVDALMALGFVSHNHHGTQSFDDRECRKDCPCPVEYGPELVQPDGNVALS